MEELKEIFIINSLPTIHIDVMLDKFKPLIKDVIFLIDISKSMSGKKIFNAISTVAKIYDSHIKEYDRVGYIVFNEKPYTIFSLTNKSLSDAYLRSILLKIPLFFFCLNSNYLFLEPMDTRKLWMH